MLLTEADIKKYLPLQTLGVSAKLEGFEIRALYKYFPKYLGNTLTDQLADESAPEALKAKAIPAWVVLTFLESIPFLDVVSTNTGFGVVRTNTVAPASKERVEAIIQACRSAANDYMDILLAFLEKNAGDYADWNKSSLAEGSLIPTVAVFDAVEDINLSRTKFVSLKQSIFQLEFTKYKSVLSAEFMSELQTGSDTIVKPWIQRSLVFAALADFEKKQNPDAPVMHMLNKANDSLQKALSYLQANLETYLTYATYGYEAPYNNETDGEESGFFIAGGTA